MGRTDDYQAAARRIVSDVGRERAGAVVDLLDQGVPSLKEPVDLDEAEVAGILRLLQAVADSSDEISSLQLVDGWEINRKRLADAVRRELDST